VVESVVQGYFNYHAVPGNIDSLQSFRPKSSGTGPRAATAEPEESDALERFGPLVARWIPSATILHPRPAMRFNASICGKSRMQQSCPYGSVRGREVNSRPYRDLSVSLRTQRMRQSYEQARAQFVRSILWWRGVFAGLFTVRFPLPLA